MDPFEEVLIEVDAEFQGRVIERMGAANLRGEVRRWVLCVHGMVARVCVCVCLFVFCAVISLFDDSDFK